MHASLVIMAAGIGSRYGGNKQTDGVGPHGEILMEYGVYDAVRAGFDKVVFIIKPDMWLCKFKVFVHKCFMRFLRLIRTVLC